MRGKNGASETRGTEPNARGGDGKMKDEGAVKNGGREGDDDRST